MLPALHIHLLGEFSLLADAEPVASLNATRAHTLLAYLLLHRDAPQSRQRLAFLFWPESDEAHARNNLRQMLHALRGALPHADSYLSADATTLRWRLEAPTRLDVEDFERALSEAETARQHHESAAERAALERAAALYRGNLLPDCYDDWIAGDRERLRQRHQQGLERLIHLLEAAQQLDAAVAHAQRLLRDDPLSEEAARRVMRLLAGAGDRAGAVRVYHHHATVLRHELGMDPGAATREEYERIVRADAVELPSAARAPALPVAAPLIGRQPEWERLGAVWRRVGESGPAFALISGEAGMGKSRLADEFARWAGQQGAATARARSYAAEGQLSLAPVIEWLRSDHLRPHLARLDVPWRAEVARILPELLGEHPDLPRPEPLSEFGQRQRFFQALALAVLAAPQPLLLVMDDLHWCDQETLEWLHFLLRYDPAARLLVLGTARLEETDAQHPLRTLLLHLGHANAVSEVALRPLDAAETARLATTILHRELEFGAAVRLFKETEGNPLFVLETVRAGLEHLPAAAVDAAPTAPPDAPPDAPALPPRVRAVIAGRLAQLSPAARDLAALAATVGREFRLDVLTHASTLSEDEAVRALDELWQRRIVRELGAQSYDFTHDKLREVAYAEVSAPQRHLLHRRIARALEVLRAEQLDAVAGDIAAHYARAGMAEQAIPYFERAAALARGVYANEDAIRYLTRALTLLEDLPGSARRDRRALALLLALAPIYRTTRGWTAPELERMLDRALALCDLVGTDQQRAEALYGLQSLLMVQARIGKVQLVADELRRLYEGASRAERPLSNMMWAGALLHLGRLVEAQDEITRIMARYDAEDVRYLEEAQGWNYLVHTRAWEAHMAWCLGYPDRALALGQASLEAARALGQPFNQALAATYFATLQLFRADAATARAAAEEALALTTEYKAPYYRVWSNVLVAYAQARETPDAPAAARLRSAIEEFQATGARLRLPLYYALLAEVHLGAGQFAGGLAAIEAGLVESRQNTERWWDAELHRVRGELLLASGASITDVEPALRRALQVARGQQGKAHELRAATSLARLWQQRGRAAQARALLGAVYEWFGEGFDTPDLIAARDLLACLA